jgi:hypothetical protein
MPFDATLLLPGQDEYLAGCPEEMPVEVENGIPVTAKTVAELRALSTGPPGDWVLDVPTNG